MKDKPTTVTVQVKISEDAHTEMQADVLWTLARTAVEYVKLHGDPSEPDTIVELRYAGLKTWQRVRVQSELTYTATPLRGDEANA